MQSIKLLSGQQDLTEVLKRYQETLFLSKESWKDSCYSCSGGSGGEKPPFPSQLLTCGIPHPSIDTFQKYTNFPFRGIELPDDLFPPLAANCVTYLPQRPSSKWPLFLTLLILAVATYGGWKIYRSIFSSQG